MTFWIYLIAGHHTLKPDEIQKKEPKRRPYGSRTDKSKPANSTNQKQKLTDSQKYGPSSQGVQLALKQAREAILEEFYPASQAKRRKRDTYSEFDSDEESMSSENALSMKQTPSQKVQILKSGKEDTLMERQIAAILQGETEYKNEQASPGEVETETPRAETAELPPDEAETETGPISEMTPKTFPLNVTVKHSADSDSEDQAMYLEHLIDTEPPVSLSFDTDMSGLTGDMVPQTDASKEAVPERLADKEDNSDAIIMTKSQYKGDNPNAIRMTKTQYKGDNADALRMTKTLYKGDNSDALRMTKTQLLSSESVRAEESNEAEQEEEEERDEEEEVESDSEFEGLEPGEIIPPDDYWERKNKSKNGEPGEVTADSKIGKFRDIEGSITKLRSVCYCLFLHTCIKLEQDDLYTHNVPSQVFWNQTSKGVKLELSYISIPNLWRVIYSGAQWLSGRVLDSRQRGRRFEPHWCHCIVSLSKTH